MRDLSKVPELLAQPQGEWVVVATILRALFGITATSAEQTAKEVDKLSEEYEKARSKLGIKGREDFHD